MRYPTPWTSQATRLIILAFSISLLPVAPDSEAQTGPFGKPTCEARDFYDGLPDDAGISWQNTDSFVLSQSFVATSNYLLTAIEVVLSGGSSPGCDETIYLQDGPTATANVLAQSSIPRPNSRQWYKATVAPFISITAGNTYYIRVTGCAPNNNVLWGGATVAPGDPYPGGEAYTDGGPSIGLDRWFATCTRVGTRIGVNKDFTNMTGQTANVIEILLSGTHTVLDHYDGYPSNQFENFLVFNQSGNTLLRWSAPNNPVLPGQTVHVGFVISGSQTNVIAGVFWRFNFTLLGCAHQVNTPHAAWGINPGNLLTYVNDALSCESMSLYAGDAVVRWYSSEIALEDLNASSITGTTPLRTDVISSSPALLAPGASANIPIPQAPYGAMFAVLTHKVGTDPGFSNGNETIDFVQTPVSGAGSVILPALSAPQRILLVLLLLGTGLVTLRASRRFQDGN